MGKFNEITNDDPIRFHKLVDALNEEIKKINPEEHSRFKVRSYISHEEIEFAEQRMNCNPFGINLSLEYIKANLLVMKETLETAIQAVENLEKINVER